MKSFLFIKAAVATVFLSLVFAASAQAQTTILVVDQNRVMRESNVGKHLQRQIESIGKSMENEMKSSTQPLVSERDRLVTELKNIGADGLKNRPDLKQRAISLQEKGSKQQMEAAYKQRELQITEQKAVKKVNDQLGTILKQIVQERNADVILDRSLVIYSGDSADITDTVISRLNSKMSTVSVVRERLPRTAPKK